MNPTRALAVMAVALCVSPVYAELVPTPGALDARVRTAPYNPDQVYRLQGTLGFAIDLVVSAEEEFVGVSGGELGAVVVSANKQRLTLKPTVAPLSTNFIVLTTLRAYHIEYQVGEAQENETPQVFSVQFTYAPTPAAGPSPKQNIEQARQKPQVLNTDYWYCGDLALEPVSASDDGIHTRLTFSPETEWPAIYVLHRDGAESLVNFSVQGHTAVIHRLFERLILRRGNLVGCVFNRALIRAQLSPASGTISPEVARTRKGASR